MATGNPNEFDFFRRGEPLPELEGKDSTAELDFFRRGEPFPAILIPAVAGTTFVAPPISTTLAVERRRLVPPVRSTLGEPTSLQVFSGPSVTLADRPARLQPQYEPFSHLSPPTVVSTAVFTAPKIGVSLARAARPQKPRSQIFPPAALQTFRGPKVTTVRARPPRTGYFLRPATVVQVPSVIQAEDTIRVALAPSSRASRAAHSRLRPPAALQVFRGPQVTLVRARPRPTRYFLRPAAIVQVPSVVQQEETIRVALAPSSKASRAAHSRLSPPTVLQVFRGPQVAVVRIRPRPTRYFLRPATVVQVPSVIQTEDTIRVTLAGRTRLEAQRRSVESRLSPPTSLRTFFGPAVALAGRTRLEIQRRASRYFLRPATVVQVPSVVQQEDTVRVTLAAVRARQETARRGPLSKLSPPTVVRPQGGDQTIAVALVAVETMVEQSRRAPHSHLGRAFYLSPLAVVTTPGQLRIETTLAAVRTRVEQVRHFARYRLFPGIVGQNPARPPLVVLAGRTRADLQRRAARSFLSAPAAVRIPAVEQALRTIRVELAPSRRPVVGSVLRAPTVVAVPPPPRDEALSTAIVAVRSRLEGRREPHSQLRPPVVLTTFSGPRTALVRRVQAILPTLSALRAPTVVSTPPPPREEGISSSLVAVRTASELVRRAPHSALEGPRIVRAPAAPVVTRILTALAPAPPPLRRAPRSFLSPPTVVGPKPTPPVFKSSGIGGSGISDEEYERLLRRLGALPSKIGLTDLDLADAVYVLKMLGLL